MGLDNYWRLGEENASVEGEFKICGGMMSGHGNDSFRGKVYSPIVEGLTGVSLYRDEIPNEEINVMGFRMAAASFKDAAELSHYELGEEEWADFMAMWIAHAEAGHSLIAWY